MATADAVQRIAAAVTPAVMVSACGLIALGLDNQAGRMSTRLRDLAREARDPATTASRLTCVQRQIALFARRHSLLALALVLDYAALFGFVATSLLSLAQERLQTGAALPLLVFFAAVGALLGMSVLALASMQLSRAALKLEADEAQRAAAERR